MAKPQLPAKAWLLEGYHEYESNPEIAHIKDVDVVFDAGDNWGCEYHEGKDFKWILGIPKRYIEFKPPVCEHCNDTGFITSQKGKAVKARISCEHCNPDDNSFSLTVWGKHL